MTPDVTLVWYTHDKEEHIMSAEILEGYVWYITDNGETEDLGYHGTDSPPCPPRDSNFERKPGQEDFVGADYLCDYKDGYLVLTDNDEEPTLLEGWTAEKAEIENDFVSDDGTWIVKALYKRGNGEMIFGGYCR